MDASSTISRRKSGIIKASIIGSNHRYIRLQIFLCALHSALPPAITILSVNRSALNTLRGQDSVGEYSQIVGSLLAIAIFLLSLNKILEYLFKGKEKPPIKLVLFGIFTLPWLFFLLRDIWSGAGIGFQFFFYPILGLSIYLSFPRLQDLAAIGWCTAGIAITSLLLALIAPAKAYTFTAKKSLIDFLPFVESRALAGIYTHPNTLGSVLALGMCFILFIESKRAKNTLLFLTFIALAMSGSRNGTAAVIAAFFVSRCTKNFKAAKVAAVVLAGITVTLAPFFIRDTSSFAGRGQIWSGTKELWQASPWLGSGSNVFEISRLLSGNISEYGFTGHNLVLDTLAKGGLIALGLLALLFQVSVNRSLVLDKGFPRIFNYLLTFLLVGFLETQLNFLNLGQSGFVIWLSFAIILFSNTQVDSFESGPKASRVSKNIRGEDRHLSLN